MLGSAQRSFDDVLAYVKEREQFGRPIGTFQALKHRIADLATEIECCRLLTYDVARKVDSNPGAMFPREASMAKLKVTEVAKRVALEGMQMMGGAGYASEYDMEGHVRRAVVVDDLRRARTRSSATSSAAPTACNPAPALKPSEKTETS